MSAEANAAYWKALGDTRSKEDRIRQARERSIRPRDRRRNAAEMDAAKVGRTAQEKLAALDWRLGKNEGAKRERARLNKHLEDCENCNKEVIK